MALVLVQVKERNQAVGLLGNLPLQSRALYPTSCWEQWHRKLMLQLTLALWKGYLAPTSPSCKV